MAANGVLLLFSHHAKCKASDKGLRKDKGELSDSCTDSSMPRESEGATNLTTALDLQALTANFRITPLS